MARTCRSSPACAVTRSACGAFTGCARRTKGAPPAGGPTTRDCWTRTRGPCAWSGPRTPTCPGRASSPPLSPRRSVVWLQERSRSPPSFTWRTLQRAQPKSDCRAIRRRLPLRAAGHLRKTGPRTLGPRQTQTRGLALPRSRGACRQVLLRRPSRSWIGGLHTSRKLPKTQLPLGCHQSRGRRAVTSSPHRACRRARLRGSGPRAKTTSSRGWRSASLRGRGHPLGRPRGAFQGAWCLQLTDKHSEHPRIGRRRR